MYTPGGTSLSAGCLSNQTGSGNTYYYRLSLGLQLECMQRIVKYSIIMPFPYRVSWWTMQAVAAEGAPRDAVQGGALGEALEGGGRGVAWKRGLGGSVEGGGLEEQCRVGGLEWPGGGSLGGAASAEPAGGRKVLSPLGRDAAILEEAGHVCRAADALDFLYQLLPAPPTFPRHATAEP